jgi:putative transposase
VDKDSIFSVELDQAVAAMRGLDFLIPLGQRHLKHTLNRWVLHYNHGRVHMSLGPGIPAPHNPSPPHSEHRHQLPPGHRVRRKAVLGRLHHGYWLEKAVA